MDVIPVVRDFIKTELLQNGDIHITDDVALIDEGYLTSLQTIELLMFLEEQFEVEIDPTEVDEDNFHSLTTIAALVERKM